MAYFDTDKTAGSTAEITTALSRVIKAIVAQVVTAAQPRISPKDILAAQNRAQAHRRAVDNLMR